MRGLWVGALVALAIACGGGSKRAMETTAPPPSGGARQTDARAEIDRLDGEITAQMQQLGEARPTGLPITPTMPAPVPMAEDPTCTPGSSSTCTDACNLTTSICNNAKRICDLASQLENDGDALYKCNRGTASCDAAQQRCCKCT